METSRPPVPVQFVGRSAPAPASAVTYINQAAPGAVAVTLSPEQRQRVKKSERMVRMDELEYRLGEKKSAIYAKIKAGRFPAPVKISARCVAWPESWVDAYIEKLINPAESSASQTKPLPGIPGADVCTAGDTP